MGFFNQANAIISVGELEQVFNKDCNLTNSTGKQNCWITLKAQYEVLVNPNFNFITEPDYIRNIIMLCGYREYGINSIEVFKALVKVLKFRLKQFDKQNDSKVLESYLNFIQNELNEMKTTFKNPEKLVQFLFLTEALKILK